MRHGNEFNFLLIARFLCIAFFTAVHELPHPRPHHLTDVNDEGADNGRVRLKARLSDADGGWRMRLASRVQGPIETLSPSHRHRHRWSRLSSAGGVHQGLVAAIAAASIICVL